MAVFNKELIINGEAVRSPEQQVYKNMKDIEALKEKIKDAYKTSEALTSSSVSVAISDTNAPDGTTEGWLMTSDGLLFSITGGDETNLLLSYYADLKGPQGEDGAAVNIDDSAVSATKVWSSQKTYLETQIGNDKGIFYTTVAPTLFSGTSYDFDLEDIANATSTKKPKIKDLVIYINNGVPTTVFEVISDSADPTLKLVGTYSQGSKLYRHDIVLSGTLNENGASLFATIINNSPLPFVKSNDYVEGTNVILSDWLRENGYTYSTDPTVINKIVVADCDLQNHYGLFVKNTEETYFYSAYQRSVRQWSGTTLTDDVDPL